MTFIAFFTAMRHALLNLQRTLISLTDVFRKNQVVFKRVFMRINVTTLVILMAFVQASATTFAQKISLNETNAPLAKVLSSIEKQSGYVFFYDNKDLALETVSVKLKDASINETLDQCFKTLPLTYKIANKTVVLSKIEPTLLDRLKAALSISISVTGTAVDEQHKPLPGVTVIIKGTETGVVTDNNGNYKIAVPNKDDVLTFSFIGYDPQDVKVDDKTVINVMMVPSSKALNDVVVVGYGTQKKVDLTGSVSTVSSADLENRPVTGVANALEGLMAGVTVQQTTGAPGGDQGGITIRGNGTAGTASASPLVVIDGVSASTADLGSVNPDDIDNISVLKDAASASIYGNRAANGVIIVTTKKGKKGTAQVTYSDYFGKQKATALPDYLPSWQVATLYNQAEVNEGETPSYSAAEIAKYKDGSDPLNYPNTNWTGLLYQGNGFQQNHYLGVNGGTDKTQYAFSLGYFDQDGIIQQTNTQRYTARLNLTTQINDKLSANASLAYTYQPVTTPLAPNPYGIITEINRISPLLPLKNAQGEYAKDLDGSPIDWLNSPSYADNDYYTFTGNVGLDWEIIKGLHLDPSLSFKQNYYQGNSFVDSFTYYNADGTVNGSPTINSASDEFTNTLDITPQVLLNYGTKIGDHNIHAVAGYSQEYIGISSLTGSGQGFINNSITTLNALPGSNTTATSDYQDVAYRSVFGRVNYDYKGKYLLEGDLRDDGSSRFAPGHQRGVFPGGSAGWRVSEEDFFAPLKPIISNLKLRGSWGRLGNQSIGGIGGYYPAISTLGTTAYPFGGTVAPGQAIGTPANPELIWETTTTTDFGLDADLLKDKLSFTGDYFIKQTSGLITPLPVAATYGYTNFPYVNNGGVQNKGWEFALTYRDKIGGFSYSVTGNASFIQNKVTSLGADSAPEIGNGTITEVGLPYNSFYGYKAIGIFQSQAQVNSSPSQTGISPHTGPGDLIYEDVNGDGKIDANDRVYLGNNFPKVTFGLNINAAYKNFELSAFFQGTAGVKNMLGDNILGQISTSNGKPTAALLDSWTPTNTSAAYPRALIDYTENDPASNPSSFWVRNASYVRLKNLQVGYTLPQQWAKDIRIKKLRVYYSGQNLFTFTQFYKWVDPEAPMQESGGTYPEVKVNSIGLNATF
jgi:TonB-linked SusC/RagA family outer membrane protein